MFFILTFLPGETLQILECRMDWSKPWLSRYLLWSLVCPTSFYDELNSNFWLDFLFFTWIFQLTFISIDALIFEHLFFDAHQRCSNYAPKMREPELKTLPLFPNFYREKVYLKFKAETYLNYNINWNSSSRWCKIPKNLYNKSSGLLDKTKNNFISSEENSRKNINCNVEIDIMYSK